MLEEARAAFPEFRRYLRPKAKLLGTAELAWYDLFAPVGDAGRAGLGPKRLRSSRTQFGAYSDG